MRVQSRWNRWKKCHSWDKVSQNRKDQCDGEKVLLFQEKCNAGLRSRSTERSFTAGNMSTRQKHTV